MLLRGLPSALPQELHAKVESLKEGLSRDDMDKCIDAIHHLLTAVWSQSWLPSKDNRITDPTILYLVFSSLLPGGSFKEPKLLTNVIARLEYCMRLYAVDRVHTFASQDLGYATWAPWLAEKTESTFNALRTLQHLASSIAFCTMSPPRIYWTDRRDFTSMLYKGDPVSLEKIQCMLRDSEKMLTKLWEHDLLFSIDLSVSYHMIKDDLSDSTPGYGFVTDRRNSCFSN
ncbi:hypothetical protein CVT26_004570, partial [Gymnopilus dilepis]